MACELPIGAPDEQQGPELAGNPRSFRSRLTSGRMWVLVCLFIVTTLSVLALGRLGIDPHHDGLVFKAARDVLDGQVPYRDSYDQYGPLLPVIQAVFMAVLGPTLLVVKASAAVFYGIAAVLLVVVWQQLVPRAMAIGLWALWLVMQPEITTHLEVLPWSSVYALALSLVGCALLCAALAHPEPRWLAAGAGVGVGLTCWFRFPVGLLALAALAIGIVGVRLLVGTSVRRILVPFLALASATIAAGIVWLWAAGALASFWRQSVVEPRAWVAQFEPALGMIEHTLWSALPVLCLVLAVIALGGLATERLKASEQPRTALLIALAAIFLATIVSWLFAWDWFVRWLGLGTLLIWAADATIVLAIVFAALALARLALYPWQRPGTPFVRVPKWMPVSLLLVVAFALASLPQFFPVFESRHIYWAASPALGVLAWVLLMAARRQIGVVLLLAVIFLTPGIASNVQGAYARFTDAWVSPPVAFGALAGMRVSPAFAAYYGGMLAALAREYRRRPDAPIMMMGNDGLWLALGRNMANADPYFLAWPSLGSPAGRARFIYGHHPIIWFEHPTVLFPVRSYARTLGYRVASHSPPQIAGDTDRWLLVPGPVVKRPPYRWRSSWGPVVGPAMMWASWGQR